MHGLPLLHCKLLAKPGEHQHWLLAKSSCGSRSRVATCPCKVSLARGHSLARARYLVRVDTRTRRHLTRGHSRARVHAWTCSTLAHVDTRSLVRVGTRSRVVTRSIVRCSVQTRLRILFSVLFIFVFSSCICMFMCCAIRSMQTCASLAPQYWLQLHSQGLGLHSAKPSITQTAQSSASAAAHSYSSVQ
jgi:hypothetical protein